jgi:hypothetical protein
LEVGPWLNNFGKCLSQYQKLCKYQTPYESIFNVIYHCIKPVLRISGQSSASTWDEKLSLPCDSFVGDLHYEVPYVSWDSLNCRTHCYMYHNYGTRPYCASYYVPRAPSCSRTASYNPDNCVRYESRGSACELSCQVHSRTLPHGPVPYTCGYRISEPSGNNPSSYKYATPRFLATLGCYLFVCLWFIIRSCHLSSLRASNFRHPSFKHGIALRRANTQIVFTPRNGHKIRMSQNSKLKPSSYCIDGHIIRCPESELQQLRKITSLLEIISKHLTIFSKGFGSWCRKWSSI